MTFAEDIFLIQREIVQLFLIDIGRNEFTENNKSTLGDWEELFLT